MGAETLMRMRIITAPSHFYPQRVYIDRVVRIHDITTDTDNPPPFVALRAVREKAPNGAAYGGDSIARQPHRI